MKKRKRHLGGTVAALVLCALLAAPAILPAQIPNSSFETWVEKEDRGLEPAGWFSTNIFSTDPDDPTVLVITRSTTARSGSYAVRGRIEPIVLGADTIAWPPWIVTGEEGEGFSYTQRPEALRGWYRLDPQGGSEFSVVAVLWQRDSVVVGFTSYSTAVSTGGAYREFVAPFSYVTQAAPDTAWIWAYLWWPSESGIETIGATFYLDDLSFGSVTFANRVEALPAQLELHQNYPNPFNPTTAIRYDLPSNANVRLSVYNTLGQEIAVLVNAEQVAARYRVDFDGSALPSGLYLYRLVAGEQVRVGKMMLMK